MKKFTLSAVVFSIFSFSSSYAGVYGALNLGANFVSTSKHLTYPLDTTPFSHYDYTSAYNNFHGQLALGYDIPVQSRFKVAVEGDVELFEGKSNATITNWFSTNSANATEYFNYGWNVFILPEYQLNNFTQLFIGPGVAFSQYHFGSNHAPTGGNLGFTGQNTSWLTGWGFKAGTSLMLQQNIDLLLTYQFMSYPSVTKTAVEPLSASPVRSKYQPTANIAMLGIKYVFERDHLGSQK